MSCISIHKEHTRDRSNFLSLLGTLIRMTCLDAVYGTISCTLSYSNTGTGKIINPVPVLVQDSWELPWHVLMQYCIGRIFLYTFLCQCCYRNDGMLFTFPTVCIGLVVCRVDFLHTEQVAMYTPTILHIFWKG